MPMIEVPSVSVPVYTDYRLALPGQRHIEQHLSRFKPDIIHLHSPCPLGYAAARYGNDRRIPVVATYHTHFPSYAKYYRVRPLESLGWSYLRKFYNSCQRVYVPSLPIMHELSWQGLHNLTFLPHGVDAGTFHPSYRSRQWKNEIGIGGKVALLFAGRLVWEKDLRTLAEAGRILRARRDDVAFVLAGDGPARAELQRLMTDAVFLGHRSGVELATAYASSDLFVFPSTTETFGNVTIEAMASGLAPICAREGGAAGFIHDGITGLLAEPRDPVDLAGKIEYLLDHPGKRADIADRALQFARRQTWEQIFRTLFDDYQQLLAESNHSYSRKRKNVA